MNPVSATLTMNEVVSNRMVQLRLKLVVGELRFTSVSQLLMFLSTGKSEQLGVDPWQGFLYYPVDILHLQIYLYPNFITRRPLTTVLHLPPPHS